MLVPEAPMHEDHRLQPGEYHVRSSWKVIPVQPESEAQRMSDPSYFQFWQGVLALYVAHYRTAAISREHVHVAYRAGKLGLEQLRTFRHNGLIQQIHLATAQAA